MKGVFLGWWKRERSLKSGLTNPRGTNKQFVAVLFDKPMVLLIPFSRS